MGGSAGGGASGARGPGDGGVAGGQRCIGAAPEGLHAARDVHEYPQSNQGDKRCEKAVLG